MVLLKSKNAAVKQEENEISQAKQQFAVEEQRLGGQMVALEAELLQRRKLHKDLGLRREKLLTGSEATETTEVLAPKKVENIITEQIKGLSKELVISKDAYR